MTLITYPTRVHFADAILEDALHSELERATVSQVLLLGDSVLTNSEFADRINTGLPRSLKSVIRMVGPDKSLSVLAKTLGADPELERTDAVIAFGSARAIDLGRKVRRALLLQRGKRPLLYAIPGVDGLPDPWRDRLESWREALPAVLICDPTLILQATSGQAMRSAMVSMMRCIESYLSDAYNPPADGIALEGFNRCITTLPKLGTAGDLALGRDVMAVSLNATMAQEKGLGPAQVLTAAMAVASQGADLADAARLILPGIVGATQHDSRKAAVLTRMLGSDPADLEAALRGFLAGLPLRPRLSSMGLTSAQMRHALAKISGRADITLPAASAILEQVF